MTTLIPHPISSVWGGKLYQWTYLGPIRMKKPHQRVYWVPYHYPRGTTRNNRSKNMRDEHMFRRQKRKIDIWLKPDRDRNRTNWFKHNVEIRNNFAECSYRNRWY